VFNLSADFHGEMVLLGSLGWRRRVISDSRIQNNAQVVRGDLVCHPFDFCSKLRMLRARRKSLGTRAGTWVCCVARGQ
jgi:hypothetical protein